MRANHLPLLIFVLITACGSSQKPFDQMTAEEHLAAAARENDIADDNFEKVTGDNIVPPETLPTGDVYGYTYAESGGAVPFTYSPYAYELNDPESFTAWPRVSDPSEKYADRASKHRENALRHERAAALLEGRPSPMPLPPEQPPLTTGRDEG